VSEFGGAGWWGTGGGRDGGDGVLLGGWEGALGWGGEGGGGAANEWIGGFRVTISVWIESSVLRRWAFAIARGGRGFSRKEWFLSSRNMTLVSSTPLFFPPTFLLKPTNQITGKVLVAKKTFLQILMD